MLMPDKHINIAESFIGLGSFVLDALNAPKNIDSLWFDFQKVNNTEQFPAYHSFENFILAVDFLFSIDAVKEDSQGRLLRCG